jgi:DNA-binding NtrC family response regulator
LHKGGFERPAGDSLDEMMANFERQLINSILEQNHFSLTRTADQLKLSRHALRYRMQRLNINVEGETEEFVAAAAREKTS